jgi:hypothetical protein
MPREADVDAQGQQEDAQAGRKRRGRGVIIKDRSVIQGDAPWQARGELGMSEHELIGLQGGIGRIETGRVHDLEAADHIKNGDRTDVAHSRHVHAADAASSSHSSWGAPCGWMGGVGSSLCF